MDIAALIYFVAFAAFAITGAVFDWRSRIIPNWLNLAFLVVGLVLALVMFGWQPAVSNLAHFAIALAAAILLFAFRLWGGGDAKFYAASAAWFSLEHIIGLFVSIAIAGLVLVLFWIGLKRVSGEKLKRGAKELPYGIAIAAGGLLMQLSNPAINFFMG